MATDTPAPEPAPAEAAGEVAVPCSVTKRVYRYRRDGRGWLVWDEDGFRGSLVSHTDMLWLHARFAEALDLLATPAAPASEAGREEEWPLAEIRYDREARRYDVRAAHPAPDDAAALDAIHDTIKRLTGHRDVIGYSGKSLAREILALMDADRARAERAEAALEAARAREVELVSERDRLRAYRNEQEQRIHALPAGAKVFEQADAEYLRMLASYGSRVVHAAWLHDMACRVEATLRERDEARAREGALERAHAAWEEYAEHAAGCVECGETSWANCHDGTQLRAAAEEANAALRPAPDGEGRGDDA